MKIPQRMRAAGGAASEAGGKPAMAANTPKATGKRVLALPRDYDGLSAMAEAVATKWEANMATAQPLILFYKTAAEFRADVDAFGKLITDSATARAPRRGYTLDLKMLDEAIAGEALPALKAYLIGRFEGEDAAAANYPRYGLVRYRRGYLLPRDRQDRLQALKMIMPALAEDGLEGKTYGAAYWQDVHDRYATALANAQATDRAAAGLARLKRQLAAQIRKVIVSLRLLLHGHYPEQHVLVWRSWGMLLDVYR